MPNLRRIRRAASIVVATAAMAVTLGATAHADPAAATPQHASSVHPAASLGCGYQGRVWSNQPTYNNCSPYSVEIDVDHIFGHDTYVCFPANWFGGIPQGDNPWYIDYAAADGVVNCPVLL